MPRLTSWLVCIAVVCAAALAHGVDIYDCYNGSAEQGGNRVTANGIQTLQYVQQSFPNAQVDVYLTGTTTHATLWQDAAGTVPLANPFSASTHGVAFVCAADGRYDFKYSLGGITTPFTVSDIKFCFSCSGGSGGLPCPANLTVGAVGYSDGAGGFNCDHLFITDGAGNTQMQSAQFLGNANGFTGYTAGLADPLQCPQPAGTPCFGATSTVYWLAPLTAATPYANRLPNTTGSPGQMLGIYSQSTINGVPVNLLSWFTPSSGCTPTGGQYAVQSNNPDGTCYGDQDFLYYPGASPNIYLGGSSGHGDLLVTADTSVHNYTDILGGKQTIVNDGAVTTSGEAFSVQQSDAHATPGTYSLQSSQIELTTNNDGDTAVGQSITLINGVGSPSAWDALILDHSGSVAATSDGLAVGDWSGGSAESVALRIQPQSTAQTVHDWALKLEQNHNTGGIKETMFGVLANGGVRTLDCISSASPAVCNDANTSFGQQSGTVVIAASATTVVVNDAAITDNSEILLTRDNSLGTKLSVTCDTQSSLVLGTPYVSARAAGTSFTVSVDVAPTTNPLCLSFHIVN